MSNEKHKPKEQSWLRALFWPVRSEDTTKIIIFVAMLALALFNYTCLRINKDALVVTAYGAGKDVLPFLKSMFVLPSTIIFITMFWSVSDQVSSKNLFYVTLTPFLAFFIIFALFLNPFVNYLHASHATIDAWQAAYPRLAPLVAIFGNWSYSLFYIWAELWGNVVISLLFWNFANAAISREDAKMYFPIFASYSNVGLMAGAGVCYYFTSASILAKKLGTKIDATGSVLTCIIISAMLFAALYWYLNEVLFVQQGIELAAPKKKSGKSSSIIDSVKLIMSSKYLLYITILVLSYGVTANLVEVTWKGIVGQIYPNKDAFAIFMAQFFLCTGFTTFMIGFFCKGIVRKFGWLFGALVTPMIMLITSVSFYVFVLFGKFVLPAAVISSSLFYALIIGAIQNILSKGGKYTLFDPTVQMAYQPLDDELRLKGKAAVDVIGGRAGKSLGGILQMFITCLIPGLSFAQQFSYMILVVILCISWVYASIALSKEYYKLLAESEKK